MTFRRITPRKVIAKTASRLSLSRIIRDCRITRQEFLLYAFFFFFFFLLFVRLLKGACLERLDCRGFALDGNIYQRGYPPIYHLSLKDYRFPSLICDPLWFSAEKELQSTPLLSLDLAGTKLACVSPSQCFQKAPDWALEVDESKVAEAER